jgi:hypothetical protein
MLDEWNTSPIAVRVFRRRDPSGPQECLTACVVGGHASPDVLLDMEGEMGRELRIQVAVP